MTLEQADGIERVSPAQTIIWTRNKLNDANILES